MSSQGPIRLVLPSLKISGGTLELLRLADDLAGQHADLGLVTLWRSPHEAAVEARSVHYLSEWQTNLRHALLQLPILIVRFARLVGELMRNPGQKGSAWIFSHYATFPLALCVAQRQRWYFVQGLEWHFPRNRVSSALLKRFILVSYRRGRLITANAFLTTSLLELGLTVEAEACIWAAESFRGPGRTSRNIDVVMVLRKGDPKRLDLYLALLGLARTQMRTWRFAAITPETEIASQVAGSVDECLLRPSTEQMRELYSRSKCFLHLSEHEGFGLPPLEAMGSGCVPICRDSGGVRAYMKDGLEALIFPKSQSIADFLGQISELLDKPAQLAAYSDLTAKVFSLGLDRASRRSEVLARLKFD